MGAGSSQQPPFSLTGKEPSAPLQASTARSRETARFRGLQEARDYRSALGAHNNDFAQAFRISRCGIGQGTEVFSLIRKSAPDSDDCISLSSTRAARFSGVQVSSATVLARFDLIGPEACLTTPTETGFRMNQLMVSSRAIVLASAGHMPTCLADRLSSSMVLVVGRHLADRLSVSR